MPCDDGSQVALVVIAIAVALGVVYWRGRKHVVYHVVPKDTSADRQRSVFDVSDWEEDVVFERRKKLHE